MIGKTAGHSLAPLRPPSLIEIAYVFDEHLVINRPVHREEDLERRYLMQIASFVLEERRLLLARPSALSHRDLQEPEVAAAVPWPVQDLESLAPLVASVQPKARLAVALRILSDIACCQKLAQRLS